MENITVTKGGYRLQGEMREVPVAFVNALRRTVLSDIPVVTITNVQILDNKSKMTHEMLRHRMEMVPIAVKPEETAVVRDTTIELRYLPSDKERTVTTDDFVVVGPRKDVILKDRDLNTPLLFMYLDPGESVHIRLQAIALQIAPSDIHAQKQMLRLGNICPPARKLRRRRKQDRAADLAQQVALKRRFQKHARRVQRARCAPPPRQRLKARQRAIRQPRHRLKCRLESAGLNARLQLFFERL
jgi:hypothetical protein